MRPPSRVIALALVGSTVVFGIATIGLAESGTFGVQTANSDETDPVVVQNESTYQVSQTLRFDVGGTNDTYVIRTEDGGFVDQMTSENGFVTLDTGFMNSGTYVLVNKTTEAVEYQFTLTNEETTTTAESSEESRRSPTVAEDEGTYKIATLLTFEVAHEGDTYELRKGDELLYVDQLQATEGSIELNTTGLDPGKYALVHGSSDDVAYNFTLVATEPTATTTTTKRNSTTTTERDSTTSEITTTATTTKRKPTTSGTPTATNDSPTTSTERATSDRTDETQTETTVNRTEGYYPSVPGFSFTSTALAVVSSGLFLYRRRR